MRCPSCFQSDWEATGGLQNNFKLVRCTHGSCSVPTFGWGCPNCTFSFNATPGIKRRNVSRKIASHQCKLELQLLVDPANYTANFTESRVASPVDLCDAGNEDTSGFEEGANFAPGASITEEVSITDEVSVVEVSFNYLARPASRRYATYAQTGDPLAHLLSTCMHQNHNIEVGKLCFLQGMVPDRSTR
jgi:hypothetical protein